MIICVDWKDEREDRREEPWRKKWEQLGSDVKVVELTGFENVSLDDVTLILIHRSVFSHNFDKDLGKFKSDHLDRIQGCVGVVTTGSGQEHVVTDEGSVCLVSTPFPPELGELATKVRTLKEELAAALKETDKQRRCKQLTAAWDTFDMRCGAKETLSALAILCQGFLAVHAVFDDEAGCWRYPDVLPALERLGWVSKNAAEEYEVVPDMAQFDIADKRSEVRNVDSYWLNVFREERSETSISTIERLREGLKKEWSSDVGPCDTVKKLLDRLEDGSLDDDDAPNAVAEAFCAVADQLDGEL